MSQFNFLSTSRFLILGVVCALGIGITLSSCNRFAMMPAQLNKFHGMRYISEGDTLNYQVLFPRNFTPGMKYPVVVFLHGAGERGSDNVSQLKHISAMFLDPKFRNIYDAVVIFPQCSQDDYWAPVDRTGGRWTVESSTEPTKAMARLMNFLDHYYSFDFVDKNRRYLAGLSMGGFGTFDLLTRSPETYAGAIAICGGADLDKLASIASVPIQIFHGAKDPVVPVTLSRDAFETLSNLHAPVMYKEYPDRGHDIWNEAMAEEGLMEWLFSLSR